MTRSSSTRPFALLLDAAGTLLHPSERVAETYAAFARRYGGTRTPDEVAAAFGDSFVHARPHRSADPGWRAYWQKVVAHATGVHAVALFEALYEHFAHAEAWRVATGAVECVDEVRAVGGKVAVVSNWDVRLRGLLEALGLMRRVDAVAISAEEELEKPDPRLFERACQRLGVKPEFALHVGDSTGDDVLGARAAGCDAWHFGTDIASFDELRERLRERSG